jgi:4-diphosphocytidyl-2C-methyl-D-erythritol kinase
MSGSGAAVIAAFEAEDDARRAVAALPASIAGQVVSTLSRHPLEAFAGKQTEG